jgi:hypothetical protein
VAVQIYGKSQGYQSYRGVCSLDGGKANSQTYSAAETEAERLTKEPSALRGIRTQKFCMSPFRNRFSGTGHLSHWAELKSSSQQLLC